MLSCSSINSPEIRPCRDHSSFNAWSISSSEYRFARARMASCTLANSQWVDDGGKRLIRPNPHLRRIEDVLALQFEGGAVIDVVADVFFVREHLMHRAPRPRPPQIGGNLPRIEGLGDFTFGFPFVEKRAVDPRGRFPAPRPAQASTRPGRSGGFCVRRS